MRRVRETELEVAQRELRALDDIEPITYHNQGVYGVAAKNAPTTPIGPVFSGADAAGKTNRSLEAAGDEWEQKIKIIVKKIAQIKNLMEEEAIREREIIAGTSAGPSILLAGMRASDEAIRMIS